MRLRDLSLKSVYNSENDNLLRDFYIPALSCATSYSRAVGFFSASTLSYAAQGLTAFVQNRGKMRLIIGAELEPDEHDAVLRGYTERAALTGALSRNFQAVLAEVNDQLFLKRLEALQWPISHQHLDIKVAVRRRGMYHAKIGILEDSSGDYVVFQGSANESLYALSPDFNSEAINVFRSWREGDSEYFAAHVESFRALWLGQSASTLVVEFPEASRRELLARKFVQVGQLSTELELDTHSHTDRTRIDRPELAVPPSFEVFAHQRISLEKWQKQDGVGILDLATGAGKTFTALYAAMALISYWLAHQKNKQQFLNLTTKI